MTRGQSSKEGVPETWVTRETTLLRGWGSDVDEWEVRAETTVKEFFGDLLGEGLSSPGSKC